MLWLISQIDMSRPEERCKPASFKVCCELPRDVTALLLNVIHDICFLHHVPLAERDELFEMVRQELSTYVYSSINSKLERVSTTLMTTYLFKADQRTEPPMIGTMCVKLNPASTTSMHSGLGNPEAENS